MLPGGFTKPESRAHLTAFLAARSDRCAHGWATAVQDCPECAPDDWVRFVAILAGSVRSNGELHVCDVRPKTRGNFEPRPADRADRYPFKFHQGDALEFLAEHAHEFDAVHASPPCQGYTTMSNRYRGQGGAADQWSRDIAPVRDALNATGLPWVIENVVGARQAMFGAVTLHGGMFGLRVHRPRLFETSWPLPPHPKRPAPTNPLGVYGARPDGRRLWTRADGSEQRAAASIEAASEALGGCDWMSWDGLRECIPPAYSEYVGRELHSFLPPGQTP